jgi:hypothetical protein
LSQLLLPTAIQTSQVNSNLIKCDFDAETQTRWNNHLQTTPQGDETNGLNDNDWLVLMQPEPVKQRRAVYYYHGQKAGECDLQKTVGHNSTIEKLERIGLIHVVEYAGGIWLAHMKKQLNPKYTIWAYSYIGIMLMQIRLGIREQKMPDFKIDYEYHLHVGQEELEQLELQFMHWLKKNPIRRVRKQ